MNISTRIAKKVLDMPPSGIRKFFDVVAEMKDAISLGVGEPDFVTPWNIREAAIYSIEKGHTHYTSNRGLVELREEICTYLTRFRLSYDINEVLVTVGASEALDLALRALVETGDEVIIAEPSYVSYMPKVLLAGGVPKRVRTFAENYFIVLPDELKAAITPKTKAFILSYPNNPTGGIMTEEQLRAIAEVLRDTEVIVIADEVYAELTYEGMHASLAAVEGMRERCIVINGFSKAFAMTGWRLGYAAAPRPLLDAMLKIHQYTMLCAPIMSQTAGLEALKSGRETNYQDVTAMVRQYNRRRRFLYEEFTKMGLEMFAPRGAFYAFPSIKSTGLSSEEFCHRLLNEYKVATVPGTAFGEYGEGHIRCSYASSMENLKEAVDRIRSFIKGL